jgi:hypothetical protein
METVVSRTLSVHKEHEMLLKLEAAGLTDDLAQKVINSKGNDLAVKVVGFLQNGEFRLATSQNCAREIMARNMFGIEEAIRYFGVNPSKRQIAVLADVPFTEATLELCKETHILIAVFPLSINDVRSKSTTSKLSYETSKLPYDSWYNKDFFTCNRGDASWQLVRKAPVENSASKTLDEQRALLAKNEEAPTARVMAYAITGHFLATGESLFWRIYVRCSDVPQIGSRISVRGCDAGVFDVSCYWDNYRYGSLGLAASRKFE